MDSTLEIAGGEGITTAEEPRLSVRGVSVGYASGKWHNAEQVLAVHDVSFDVEAGEFIAIIGPSGCGKSTLLNAIAGLLEPSAGTISVEGDRNALRLGNIAYMQQRDVLLPWRTVLANARLGLELKGIDRRTADDAVSELVVRFGLGDVINSYPWQLSGGMRQRVALLRASLPDSGVLLLDEPFGALDAITRRDLQRWLAGVLDRTDRAVLLVTHDVEEALLLADRVFVMSPPSGNNGGTIAARVVVPLPRPRREETVTMPQFVDLKSELMSVLSDATRDATDSGAQ
jgi:ABC-type nitrate/sulfonate/bicarbonate transport system ATPase subunit